MQALLHKSTSLLPGIFIVLFISSIISLQIKYDRLSPTLSTKTKIVTRNLLPAQILPYTNFGFNAVLADYYWIKSIQDFIAWDGKDMYFLDYFKNISTLDPRFEYPYLFSILVIPQNKDIVMLDAVAKIAQTEIDTVSTSWKIPYYLGTNYYLFTKKYSPAREYLEIAANKEGAPAGVYLTYSSFVAKDIEGNKATQEMFKVIFNNTESETIKKLASLGFQESVLTQLLEKSIVAYKAKYGKYPQSIEELLALKFIALPPDLLDSFSISINQKNGSFKVEEKK